MHHVRLSGDPFGPAPHSEALRAFLHLLLRHGLRGAIDVSAVPARPLPAGERAIRIGAGADQRLFASGLGADDEARVLAAIDTVVAATAPVLVFAPAAALDDARKLAALAWPRSCRVLAVPATQPPDELLQRLRSELRWAGGAVADFAHSERELQPWLRLPPPPSDGPLFHPGSADPADGTDLLLTAFAQHCTNTGQRLRVLVDELDEALLQRWRHLLRDHAPDGSDPCAAVEFAAGPLAPAWLRDCSAVVLPWRALRRGPQLVLLLASGRPVVVSRFADTAAMLSMPGICLPLGGRMKVAACSGVLRFEPDPAALAHALLQCAAVEANAGIGLRARAHVQQHLMAGVSAAPPALPRDVHDPRPLVVLEAPLFETSSTAELTIETALALQRRGNVQLRLVPNAPFRTGLDALRARAPRLEACLGPVPAGVDLWLSSGWPVRVARPPCRRFAVRVDWEYGALPVELAPMVTDEADHVLVHSHHVLRTLVAAGCAPDRVALVPHGVDAALRADAPPLAEVLAHKGAMPAVLFCGGLVFRKGFDLFLRAVLAARAQGVHCAVVVKTVGLEQHYQGFHLGDLLDRFAATPGAPRVLRIDRDLSRAELAGMYAACDLLLHPYRGEGFGLPVLEARACGLPVLVTGGGAADDCSDGPGARRIPATRRELALPGAHFGTPWVLEPDPEVLTRELASCLRDLPALRAAARDEAPRVRQQFAWDHAAAAIERLAFAAAGRPAHGEASVPVARSAAVASLPAEPVVALPPQRSMQRKTVLAANLR